MIAHARLALQRRLLRIGDTTDARGLADELRSYRDQPRRPITHAAGEDWWRLRDQDDLVLALCAGLWHADRLQATGAPASPADSPLGHTYHYDWSDPYPWRRRRPRSHP